MDAFVALSADRSQKVAIQSFDEDVKHLAVLVAFDGCFNRVGCLDKDTRLVAASYRSSYQGVRR